LVRLNRIVIFLPLVVIFSMIVNLPFVNSEEDVDLLFEKGLESYRDGKLEVALSYFDKVLEIEPNHLNATNNKGVLLKVLGKADEALSYFDKVLEIEPNDVDALSNKGSILGSLLKLDEAMIYLDRALEIEPNHIDALSNKAAVLADQGNYYDSATYFYQVLQVDPHNKLANYYLPIAKASIGAVRVKGFAEFMIHDDQKNLIVYFKSPYLTVLNHTIAWGMIDAWPVVQVISYNGTDYEVLQRIYTTVYQTETVFSHTGVYADNNPGTLLISSPNWGVPITYGDTVVSLYTYFRPIE